MKLNQLVGQLTLIGISGLKLTSHEKKFIVENNISGVVLFARNVGEPRQIYDLCNEIQELRHQMADQAPLFIGIDMEGGRVHRLQPPFTQWPALKTVGDLDAPTVAFKFTLQMGSELMAVGINLNFAPCVDIFNNPENTIIGDRAVSSNHMTVEKMTSALVRGYLKSGIFSCAKHFPGHGYTVIDSHEELPIEPHDLQRLNDVELLPFKKAFRNKVDMVMTGHISFPKIDSRWPVTLSEVFLKNMIKKEMKYRGLIITDDLDMKAMAIHYDKAEIPVRSFEAGADLILYCNEPESPPMAIAAVVKAIESGRLNKADIELAHAKVLAAKKGKNGMVNTLTFEQAVRVVGNKDHQYLADCLRQKIMPDGIFLE